MLIDGCNVAGASDAGIYVGQSNDITVRHSIARRNVAGIEIENSRNALVSENVATRNTGGILVFDLPSLPVMGGGNVIVRSNAVTANDTPNFAPEGNIVASVRRGTGIMVMANDKVLIESNAITGNATAARDGHGLHQQLRRRALQSLSAPGQRWRRMSMSGNGTDPQIDGAPMLLKAFGGSFRPVLWDGLRRKGQRALRRVRHPDGAST